MNYLAEKDYLHLIRSEVKSVIVNDAEIQLDAELAAESEIKSYLTVSYDVDKLFKKHTAWSPALVYQFNDFVILLGDSFDALLVYQIDSLVEYAHSTDGTGVYIATSITVAAEDPETTPGKWTRIAAPNSFYQALQTDDFVLGTLYLVGEFVVYLGVRYIVTVNTTGVELPTDTSFWAVDSAVVAIGTLPTVTTEWTSGDVRYNLIVRYMIDIVLYELHSRINPRNIPEHRMVRRDDAIAYLKAVNDPRNNITPDFPLKSFDENTDTIVLWGSNDKINHGNNIY